MCIEYYIVIIYSAYFKYQEASHLKFLGLLMENIDKSYDKEGFHKGTNIGPILS